MVVKDKINQVLVSEVKGQGITQVEMGPEVVVG